MRRSSTGQSGGVAIAAFRVATNAKRIGGSQPQKHGSLGIAISWNGFRPVAQLFDQSAENKTRRCNVFPRTTAARAFGKKFDRDPPDRGWLLCDGYARQFFEQVRGDRIHGHEQRIEIRELIEPPRKPHIAVVLEMKFLRRQYVDMDLIPHDS